MAPPLRTRALSLGWHDLARASLTDFPDAQFSIQEDDSERQAVRFGAALSFSGLKGFKTSLSYNGEIRGSSNPHSIFGFVRYEF